MRSGTLAFSPRDELGKMSAMATPQAPVSITSSAPLQRIAAIALAVLVAHAAVIWALLRGSDMRKGVALMVPVSLLVSPMPPPVARSPFIDRSTGLPETRPSPPILKSPLKPKKPSEPTPAQKPEPAKQAPTVHQRAISNDQAPAEKPSGATSSQATAPEVQVPFGPAAESRSTVTATPSLGLDLPNSDADYLRNPKPVYPALSQRLNEQGTVIHSVLIAADGRPLSARLVKSSGFDRLDKAAYKAVMQWRYVPGKRQGVPEAMSFNVPVKWVLE